MPDNILTGKLPVFQKGVEVSNATGHRCELPVIFLGDFNIEPFSKLHHDVEEIHGIQVNLVPEIILIIYSTDILVRSNIG